MSRAEREFGFQLRTAAGAAARFNLPRSPWLPLTEVAAAKEVMESMPRKSGCARPRPPVIVTPDPTMLNP